MQKNKLERYAEERGMTPKQALEKLFEGGQKLETVAAELSLPSASIWVYIRQYGANWHSYKSFVYNGKLQTMTKHCAALGVSHTAVVQTGLRTGLKQAALLDWFMSHRPATVSQHAIQTIRALADVHGCPTVARTVGVSREMIRDLAEGKTKTVRRALAQLFVVNLDVDLEQQS